MLCDNTLSTLSLNLKNSFCPRKTQKAQNKTMGYVKSPEYPLGEIENLGMLLNLFVFFASFCLMAKYLPNPPRTFRG